MTAPKPDHCLRLMTWNIHGGIGPDRRFDLDRVAALIRRHDPDILALQEVDTRGRDLDCLHPLQQLHDENGGCQHAHTMFGSDGHYGHTLYTRWPLQTAQLHDLTFGKREPRCAIEGVVETPLGPLHVVAVHLGLHLGERSEQSRRLVQLAQRSRGVATVALGDFNDWFYAGAVRRRLRRHLPVRSRLATFPARRPLLMLDRIYTRAPGDLVQAWTDPEGRHCSDHLPLIADFALH